MKDQVEQLKKVYQELCEKNKTLNEKIKQHEAEFDFNDKKSQDETEKLRDFAQDLETQLSILDCVIESLEIMTDF